MIISALDEPSSKAVSVTVADDMLAVTLHDGRSIRNCSDLRGSAACLTSGAAATKHETSMTG